MSVSILVGDWVVAVLPRCRREDTGYDDMSLVSKSATGAIGSSIDTRMVDGVSLVLSSSLSLITFTSFGTCWIDLINTSAPSTHVFIVAISAITVFILSSIVGAAAVVAMAQTELRYHAKLIRALLPIRLIPFSTSTKSMAYLENYLEEKLEPKWR